MVIEINADKHLSVHGAYAEKIKGIIQKELDRFADILTRTDVYFSDENATRKTSDDKRCTLEARIKGKNPIAASAFGDSYDQALNAAIDKLRASLKTITDKMKAH
ncbi:hypothetical protein GCM10027051_18860 [Niabella terrae]